MMPCRRHTIIGLIALCGLLSTSPLYAQYGADKPFISPIFGSDMVLQRDARVPIWGWARPGDSVRVTLQEKRYDCVADATGLWVAVLDPVRAGGPHDLEIAGMDEVILRNVMFGDVWICAGQSNLTFGIAEVMKADEEIRRANHPEIRLYCRRQTTAVAPKAVFRTAPASSLDKWFPCSPATILSTAPDPGGFSALAYFFGRKLHQELNVPIGLIELGMSGSPVDGWISRDTLAGLGDYSDRLTFARQVAANPRLADIDYDKRLETWYAANDPGTRDRAELAVEANEQWDRINLPSGWTGSNADHAGVTWFQRELYLRAEATSRPAVLHLGGIGADDTVWINGIRVGRTISDSSPRKYDVRPGLLRVGLNMLTIRLVEGRPGVTTLDPISGFLGTDEEMKLVPQGLKPIRVGGEWTYRTTVPGSKSRARPRHILLDGAYPTALFNGMVAPLVPMAIKGVLWSQGERDVSMGDRYGELLASLIRDWRWQFGSGSMPFLRLPRSEFAFVVSQLSAFGPKSTDASPSSPWAEMRDSQARTVQFEPNCALAATMDLNSDGSLHSRNKQEEGARLAAAALGTTYGRRGEFCGPIFQSFTIVSNAMRIRFSHATGGLRTRGGEVKGFCIAGPDGVFLKANAEIRGDTVVVSSPQVRVPSIVTYGWADNPDCTLENGEGFQAEPFRTDRSPRDWTPRR